MSTIGVGLCLIATYATLTQGGPILVVLQSAVHGWLLSRGRTIGRVKVALQCQMIRTRPASFRHHHLARYHRDALSNLLDNQSLVERLLNWGLAVQTWTDNGTMAFIFGNGTTQGMSNAGYVVDNNFLNFAVQSGVVGLVSCVGLMFTLWMSLRQVVEHQLTPLRIAMCAFWSTWIVSGTFNWTNPIYAIILMPLLASSAFGEITSAVVPGVRTPRYANLPMSRPTDL